MPATKPYKAVAAFVLTFLGTLLASLQGRKEFAELTLLEWIIVIGSALVTTGAVYQIDNRPTGTRRNEVGEGGVLYIVVVVVLVLAAIWLLSLLIR